MKTNSLTLEQVRTRMEELNLKLMAIGPQGLQRCTVENTLSVEYVGAYFRWHARHAGGSQEKQTPLMLSAHELDTFADICEELARLRAVIQTDPGVGNSRGD